MLLHLEMWEATNIFNFKSPTDLGNKFFLIGTFFLPSAFPISAIFFIVSLVISYSNYKVISFRDKWNIPLFICIGLMIFSTLNVSIFIKPDILSNYNNSDIWVNLINWIPIFFYFWGFQLYLKNYKQRIKFVEFLISGTMPVILSMILQKFFKLYGPFETFFGLVVWFQKPLKYNAVTGLFSNPNYTAIWLAMVLPFVFFLFTKIKEFNFKKYFLLTILVLFLYLLFLTQSRNGFLAILLTLFFVFRYSKLSLLTVSSFSFISLGSLAFIASNYKKLFSIYFPQNLLNRLYDFDFSESYRTNIWQSAILRIQERPIFGWGGSTFSFLHSKYEDLLTIGKFNPAYHSHNMVLEVAHSFGLPLALLFFLTLFLFFIRAWNLIFLKNNSQDKSIFNKAWFLSVLFFLLMHLTDVTFYDGKISILICILFAGLKNIINDIEKKNYKSQIK